MSYSLPPEKFELVIRLLDEGLFLKEIVMRKDTPSGMAVHNKRKRDADYRARLEAAMIRGMAKRERPSRNDPTVDWDAAIERVKAGEKPSAFYRQPGMPTAHQWRHRRRTDPTFAAIVDPILHQKFKPGPVSPEAWKRTLKLLAAGTPIGKVGNRHIPGTVSVITLYEEAKRNQSFKQKLEAALGRPLRQIRTFTTQDYDRALAEVARTNRLYGRRQDEGFRTLGLPPPSSIKRRAILDPKYGSALSAAYKPEIVRWSDEKIDRALAAIRNGHHASKLQELGLMPYTTLAWRGRRNPEFRARFKAAVQSGSGLHQVYRGLGEAVGANLRRALGQNDVYATVAKAVPTGLPSFVRDDVIGEMVAEVLEGLLHLGDVAAAAREYVSDYYRQVGPRGAMSIDAPWGRVEGRTGHDLVA